MKRKIIILEGLPGVGKSSILEHLKSEQFTCIDEILDGNARKIQNGTVEHQDYFLRNDTLKVERALMSQGVVIIDRGPLSTLAYNLSKHKIVKAYNFMPVISWFITDMRAFYGRKDVTTVYLKGASSLPYEDESDPYGSSQNQKLLENITLKLAELFCKNLQVIEYDYLGEKALEHLKHEILN